VTGNVPALTTIARTTIELGDAPCVRAVELHSFGMYASDDDVVFARAASGALEGELYVGDDHAGTAQNVRFRCTRP
jgi:hypothetical protein